MKRNWKPVIKSLLDTLAEHGFEVRSVDNGDGPVAAPAKKPSKWALDEIAATDESHLTVKGRDGKVLWLFVVLGNEPFETVCDYNCNPALDAACEAFSEKWEGRACPLTED